MAAGEHPEPGREAILEALERHGVRYVVIGGAAAQARGWEEQTQDLDITPERSQENLSRLGAAVEELGGAFRVDEQRYPDGFRPPGGIDARTFRGQICVAFVTRHGNFDVVMLPDGTRGYEEIAQSATRERMAGTNLAVPVASGQMILHSKETANRQKDRDTLQRMREILDPGSTHRPRDPWARDPWRPGPGHDRGDR